MPLGVRNAFFMLEQLELSNPAAKYLLAAVIVGLFLSLPFHVSTACFMLFLFFYRAVSGSLCLGTTSRFENPIPRVILLHYIIRKPALLASIDA